MWRRHYVDDDYYLRCAASMQRSVGVVCCSSAAASGHCLSSGNGALRRNRTLRRLVGAVSSRWCRCSRAAARVSRCGGRLRCSRAGKRHNYSPIANELSMNLKCLLFEIFFLVLLFQCDGASPLCPSDALRSAGSVCRSARDACDIAELR